MVNLFSSCSSTVFITPAGRRPGAAAGPASLTLQSGFAQESVVVRGSPRTLPGDPGHGASFHSGAHQQQDISALRRWKQVLLDLVSVQINTRQSSRGVQRCLSQTALKSPLAHAHIYLGPRGLCRDQIRSIVEPSNVHFCSYTCVRLHKLRLLLHLWTLPLKVSHSEIPEAWCPEYCVSVYPEWQESCSCSQCQSALKEFSVQSESQSLCFIKQLRSLV